MALKKKRKKKLKKKALIRRAGATKLYELDDEAKVLLEFSDDLIMENGKKKQKLKNKAEWCCSTAKRLFAYLEKYNVPHAFESQHDATSLVFQKFEHIPLKFVIRNVASNNLAKKIDIREGSVLDRPILEFYYDNADLQYPLLNQYHVYALNIVNKDELDAMSNLIFKINAVIKPFLIRRGILLYDFMVEIGRVEDKFVLSNGIMLDNCSFVVQESKEKYIREASKIDPKIVRALFQKITKMVEY